MKDEEGKERDWLTVGEAAEYLGVSEPTLFRWMRAGQVTYYKVGGNTRFTRKGLDAVVEKNTGQREAEGTAGRCASCGHGVLLDGRLQGTGRLYFRPERTSFWVWTDSMVATAARVCAACGYLHLFADTAKLGKLDPEAKKVVKP